MIKEDFEEYIGKEVVIQIKNGFKFSGKVLKLTDSVLIIDDFKDGKVKFNLFDVVLVRERW